MEHGTVSPLEGVEVLSQFGERWPSLVYAYSQSLTYISEGFKER